MSDSQPQQTQVTVGPPDLRTVDRRVLQISKYLYKNPILKQREAILNGQRVEMFRLKRAVRALQDPAYGKLRSQPNSLLPELPTEQACIEMLQALPRERMAFNIIKVEQEDATERGLKPQSGVPCVLISPQQTFTPDDYFVWLYQPVPWTTYLYGVFVLIAIFAVVLFPLWPLKLRKGGYYVSMLALFLLVALLVLSVIRLIVFCFTYVAVKPGIWLFPNLFADLGFFESFQPVWSWSGERTLPKKATKKKRSQEKKAKALAYSRSKAAGIPGMAPVQGQQRPPAAAGVQNRPGPAGPAGPAGPTGPMGGLPLSPDKMQRELIQNTLKACDEKSNARVKEYITKNGARSPQELEALKKQFFQEELMIARRDLQEVANQAQKLKEQQSRARS